MTIKTFIAFFAVLFITSSIQAKDKKNDQNVLNFLNLKFGMFIHYNMGTYHAEQWAYPFHDPKDFKPVELDCEQWAQAAKSAGMQYAVFTTKHHDGSSLWDTKVSNYDIASADKEYKNVDIVKEYVDAFREAGITVGSTFRYGTDIMVFSTEILIRKTLILQNNNSRSFLVIMVKSLAL